MELVIINFSIILLFNFSLCVYSCYILYKYISISCQLCRDNFILLQAIIASIACYIFPTFIENVPVWNTKGFITILILHVGMSEPLYYWVHRCFHESYPFTHYHSLHHSSHVLHPFTGKKYISNK